MIVLFQNIFMSQEFLTCIGCFGLFIKMNRGSGTTFWCTFSAYFFLKNFLILSSINWPSFNIRPFFLLKISNNEFLNSCLANRWRHKLWLILDHLLGNGWQEEKNGKEIQKFEYLEMEKSFFKGNKKHFSHFVKGYHLVKKNFKN